MNNLLQFPKKEVEEFTELDLQIGDLLLNHSMSELILSLVANASDEDMALIAPAAREVFNLDFEAE